MTVLQSWVEAIPLRMQSTLLLGLRGPDTHRCPEVKKITRWLRGVTFKPANPANVSEFMGATPGRIAEKGPCARELEFCTQHFCSHLMHALEVVGYCHPDGPTGRVALLLYLDVCALFHLPSESVAAFRHRLRQIDWPKGQPDSFEEALAQLEPESNA